MIGSSQAIAAPILPEVSAAIKASLNGGEIAGAVTMVVTKDRILHLEAAGFADIEKQKAMEPQTLFWIASKTKPITATAVLLLQDEGRLKVTDPVTCQAGRAEIRLWSGLSLVPTQAYNGGGFRFPTAAWWTRGKWRCSKASPHGWASTGSDLFHLPMENFRRRFGIPHEARPRPAIQRNLRHDFTAEDVRFTPKGDTLC